MHRRILAFLAVLALAIALTGCSASASQMSASASSAPAYDGALYDFSFVRLSEEIPEIVGLNRYTMSYTTMPYQSIVLASAWPEGETYTFSTEEYGWNRFCDASFQALPMEGYLYFLGMHDGYRVFYDYNGQSTTREYWDIEVYDPQGTLVLDTAGKYYVGSMGAESIYVNTGWFPMIDNATNESGFLNLYTQEWMPLPDGNLSIAGGGEFGGEGDAFQSFFAEGLAHVMDSEPMRTYYPDTILEYSDYNIAGFIDEDGEFAFRFSDIDEFDGIILNEATGFLNGTCIVTGRVDDGIKTGPLEEGHGMFDRNLFYRIDTTGHIVEEVDYETFLAFRVEVLDANGQFNEKQEHSNFYAADSIQIADGLTLRSAATFEDNALLPASLNGAYELADSNGHVWDLRDVGDLHSISEVIVSGDGTVLVYGRSNAAVEYTMDMADQPADEWDESASSSGWYRLVCTPIAPEGFSVPDEYKQNLSPDGWPTCYEYNTQIQEICVDPVEFGMDVPVTITCTADGVSASYQPTSEDYLIFFGDEDSGMLSAKLYMRAEGEITVACDWTDENGETHRGYYAMESYMLSDEPVPYCSQ